MNDKKLTIHILTDNGQDSKDKWDEYFRQDFDNLFKKGGFSYDGFDGNNVYYDILEQDVLDEVWVSYKGTEKELPISEQGGRGMMIYRVGKLYGYHNISWCTYDPRNEWDGFIFSDFELCLVVYDNMCHRLDKEKYYTKQTKEHVVHILKEIESKYSLEIDSNRYSKIKPFQPII